MTETKEAEYRLAQNTTVIICAYTMDRWESLLKTIDSVRSQRPAPRELIVIVDDVEMQRRVLSASGGASLPKISCEINLAGQGLTGARNTGASYATGELLVYVDDDAEATETWMAHMIRHFADNDVVAVGGNPIARYEGVRPRWWPAEFDWVLGCSYRGLPEHVSQVRHVIGTTFAVRQHALEVIGGFHGRGLEDFDMSMRLAHSFPDGKVLFDPTAVVHHAVPANRLTWRYFWRRCFFENRTKADVVRSMGAAGSLVAEREHALRVVPSGVGKGIQESLAGDSFGLARAIVLTLGMILAGSGMVTGLAEGILKSMKTSFRAGAEGSTVPKPHQTASLRKSAIERSERHAGGRARASCGEDS